ncbi:MAG TPA: DMT family transporter [Bacteroidales bacterium]|nr:DMT family transporter [Bacteroidales bacterium]
MKNKQAIIGALAVIFASIMWGFDGIVLTPRLFNLDVIFVVFMLHLIPFVIMNLFLYKEYRHMRNFTYGDVFFLFLIAMFGGILGTVSIVKALFLVNFKHLTVVVLLQKLQPVFSIALAAIILGERIRRRFVLWAGVAIAASYFLVFGFQLPRIDADHETAQAAFFALLAAFAFGSSTVFSKKILNKYSFHTGTFYRYGFTSLILLLVVVISGRTGQFDLITTNNWIYFLIIAFTTGSGAIFLYYFGLIRIRAVLATMCELFFPLSAIVFDYIFNGKLLNPVQWVAAALMIFAIIQLNRNKR